MEKYTEMNNDRRCELYMKFLFFMQAKYASGTEAEIKLYEFALRYNLLPKYYADHLTPKDSCPMYKGYLLFLKEKFGIIDYDILKTSDFLTQYSLVYTELMRYSFDDLMNKLSILGINGTTRFVNDLSNCICFKNMNWSATRFNTKESEIKVKILNKFQDHIFNKNELDLKKLSNEILNGILKLPLNKDEKIELVGYLKNVKNSYMYHNTIRQMSLNVIDFYTKMQRKTITKQMDKDQKEFISQER